MLAMLSLTELAAVVGTTIGATAPPADRHVLVDGLRLHYLEWSDSSKPALVLLHSGEETAHSWDLFAQAFGGDFRVLALDSRGCGRSEHTADGRYTQEGYVRDVIGLINMLELHDAVLIGQAYGARHALIAATQRPDRVRALVIVDTAPEVSPEATSNVHAYLRATSHLGSYEDFVRIVAEHNPLRLQSQVNATLHREVCRLDDGSWGWMRDLRTVLDSGSDNSLMRTPAFLWSCLAELRCPTMIVRGACSPFVTAELAERMCRTVPDARLATVARAGHLVAGDNPAEFERVVREFLSSVAGIGPRP